MSDVTPPDQDSRYGHFTFARDSASVAQWFRHHAGEHGFELDAAQTRALQHFKRLYDELTGLERLDGSLVRLLALERAGVYHVADHAEEKLEQAFVGVARHESADRSCLEIEGRMIVVRKHARGAAWFNFAELCDGPLIERLVSRLTEMQTRDYLTQPHLP